MARRNGLFIGRLNKNIRTRDLEEVFEVYGRMTRCDIKYGAEMAFAFIDYEDRRDAEDALKYENGRDVCGSAIIVEWAKGSRRPPGGGFDSYRGGGGGYGGDRGNYGGDRYSGGPSRDRGGRYRSPSPKRRSSRRSRSRSPRKSGEKSGDRRRRSGSPAAVNAKASPVAAGKAGNGKGTSRSRSRSQ